MTQLSDPKIRHQIDRTIRALFPIIEERIKANKVRRWGEYDLRKELVSCILGSQVRYEMAAAATANLISAGLLDDAHWICLKDEDFENRILDVLTGKIGGLPYKGSYRFPKARSKQLAQVRNAVARVPLSIRLECSKISKHLRKGLVNSIPGLGPKQASMFLRNIGRSYDLAILDTHVLRFMHMQELLPIEQASIGTINGYEKAEAIAIGYANSIGHPAGYLDLAIWATMKAAREIGL